MCNFNIGVTSHHPVDTICVCTGFPLVVTCLIHVAPPSLQIRLYQGLAVWTTLPHTDWPYHVSAMVGTGTSILEHTSKLKGSMCVFACCMHGPAWDKSWKRFHIAALSFKHTGSHPIANHQWWHQQPILKHTVANSFNINSKSMGLSGMLAPKTHL